MIELRQSSQVNKSFHLKAWLWNIGIVDSNEYRRPSLLVGLVFADVKRWKNANNKENLMNVSLKCQFGYLSGEQFVFKEWALFWSPTGAGSKLTLVKCYSCPYPFVDYLRTSSKNFTLSFQRIKIDYFMYMNIDIENQ